MVQRLAWQRLIERLWTQRPVIWLFGVRRSGKTVLCQSLPRVEYFDCELLSVRRLMASPESFLESCRGHRIVLDEIHRLQNPSELLKIAADHYPDVRVIATGSSTLGASSKFSDTLTGRKRNLWLTPMTLDDMAEAGRTDLEHRLLHGGLPPFLLTDTLPEQDFQEWMDAYWAKDIQELFRVERRTPFQKFAELLLTQSGGLFEASRFAKLCEVSRPTIANYLKVMEATLLMHIVRPFSTHRATEIVSMPKVYGFDTGFVCAARGWQQLRTDDLGQLWEHFVLNEISARLQHREIFYWRDKRGHELDFVLPGKRLEPMAIECKWSADDFDATNLKAFRTIYPEGENVVVASNVDRSFVREYGRVRVRFESLAELAGRFES